MSAMAYIRKEVFRQTQAAFAVHAGVAQATVSRWETGNLQPTIDQLTKIRDAAISSGLKWNDSWFFVDNVSVNLDLNLIEMVDDV